jgi:hypothetical protein
VHWFCVCEITARDDHALPRNVGHNPRHREKLNEINNRHRGLNPLPVSATPPLLSYSQDSLFYGVVRARHRHPHRSSAQTDSASLALHRSMILAEIAKTQ